MAGIYIHIPFCKQICHYCDFYKIANLRLIDEFVNSIIREIKLKKDVISEHINTIYFGGGTPSALPIKDISKILTVIFANFQVSRKVELTIEINPDDALPLFYEQLIELGFNRLSIGIQSFNDKILRFLNRRHTVKSAIDSVNFARAIGFDNISLDLIYGIPSQTINDFKLDLKLISEFGVQHLSAYHLGIEEGTYFGKLKQHNKLSEIDEDMSKLFFDCLTEFAHNQLFEHYEVSSFAKSHRYSMHNMNYWFNISYIGFGPSAHSYYNNSRYFNTHNINQYIQQIDSGTSFYQSEQLSILDKFNEFVMLRLRTKWGLSLTELGDSFGERFHSQLLRKFSKFQDSDYIRTENDHLYLTETGFFVSDYIIRELFIV